MPSHRSNQELLHSVWNNSSNIIAKEDTPLDKKTFDELIASIFCPGPCYYYIVDFYDRQIKYMNPNIKNILGFDPDTVEFDDIIGAIHPDDINYVTKAESTVLKLIYDDIGREKSTRYKMSYCFRFKTVDGSYQLFQHQAIILTTDAEGRFAKSLNIHTNINHLTNNNNYKASLIGILGEPSYFNIDVYNAENIAATLDYPFTKRELEIIRMISEGLTSKQVGQKLSISEETVKTHRRNLLSKSGAKNLSQLISKCIHDGLI
jgi:DNA-binding CsgD family transcriptional regulator